MSDSIGAEILKIIKRFFELVFPILTTVVAVIFWRRPPTSVRQDFGSVFSRPPFLINILGISLIKRLLIGFSLLRQPGASAISALGNTPGGAAYGIAWMGSGFDAPSSAVSTVPSAESARRQH